MITMITVNYNSYYFLHLLVESIERFSTIPYELIIIDNSENRLRVNQPNIYQFLMPQNIGHGKGLNLGVTKALEMFPKNKFIMFLDVDCHFLRSGWEMELLQEMKNYDIIGGKGVKSKPIRPACMFLKKELAKYDWNSTEGYKGHRVTPTGYDVAIKAYYKIMADGYKIGFLNSIKDRYGTVSGEEWCVNDKPFLFHHWHGTHLKERQVDFPDVDLIENKKKLFERIPWRLP